MNDLPEKVPRRRKGKGCIFSRPDSPLLWIKYSRHGKIFRESTGTADSDKAQKKLDKRLAELSEGTFLGPQVERFRMQELYEDVERNYRIKMRKSGDDLQARWSLHLKPFFGALRAVDVTSNLITRYVDSRQKAGASNATINRELAVLKRMFHLGQKPTPPKVLRVPHIEKLTEDNVRRGFLEPDQHDRVAAECSKVGLWLRAMFELSYTFGWRLGEVLGLRVRQLDVAHKRLSLDVGATKNGRGRLVILTDGLAVLLSALIIGKKPVDFLFTRPNGNRVSDFRRSWKKVCANAGVPDLLYHDLRRTAVRGMTRRGITEHVAMTTGHKTRCVFDRYDIVTETELRAAARKMEQPEIGTQLGHVASFEGSQPSEERVN